MREITENIPKALVPIGPAPIILHVMNMYRYFGYRQYIICLGYRGDAIKDFFMNYHWKSSTLRIRLGKHTNIVDRSDATLDGTDITFVDTGLDTNTGGRIKKIERFIATDHFLANYCDVLSDVNIREVHQFHRRMGKTGTLVAARPMSRYGIVTIQDGLATSFKEKPFWTTMSTGDFLCLVGGYLTAWTRAASWSRIPFGDSPRRGSSQHTAMMDSGLAWTPTRSSRNSTLSGTLE